MGTLYLIDAHNPVLLSSKINDTANLLLGDTASVRGSFPVNIPFDIPMDGAPSDLDDLITKKYQGMLSIYPGFNNILFDEQVDALDWDTGQSQGCTLGSRQNNSVHGGVSDYLVSTIQTLANTPDLAVVRFEVFQYIEENPVGGQYTRKYQDISTESDFHFEVTFDGSNFTEVTNGTLVNIPLSIQGDQFGIRFHRTAEIPAFLGSWAVIY